MCTYSVIWIWSHYSLVYLDQLRLCSGLYFLKISLCMSSLGRSSMGLFWTHKDLSWVGVCECVCVVCFCLLYLCRWGRHACHSLGRHTHSALQTPTSPGESRCTGHSDTNLQHTNTRVLINITSTLCNMSAVYAFYLFWTPSPCALATMFVLLPVNSLFATKDN